jgi:hypothetical protein
MSDVNERTNETAETGFLRAIVGDGTNIDEDFRDEHIIVKKKDCQMKRLEYLHRITVESRSCSIKVNIRAEDAREV